MNLVLTLDEQLIKKLKDRYAKYQVPSKNEYIDFFAKVENTSISLYTSNKVVFQGHSAEKLAQEFGYTASKADQSLPQFNIIGTDEVGNGSYFGGLMVVASFIRENDISLLKELGVDDSKKLTDEKIVQIAPQLMDKIIHVTQVVEPDKYNQVIAKGYNAVSIKVALHNQAIYLLEKKLDCKPEAIIIDAFTSPNNYQKYLVKEKNQVKSEITLLTKAESQFLAVATSSIIARFLFLENLENLSEQSGYDLPSGAGIRSDQVAAQIIKEKGIESLNPLVKLHFANTEKAKCLALK
ncbi:MAG: ribonuclease HIII [Streptococcaceae bacterium]|nr:ribonuclease HIII [Streptococcaceae bacterium]